MKRNTHKVNNKSWFKLCPDCERWFHILLKPPGIDNRDNLPPRCQPCSKVRYDKSKMKSHDVLAEILFDEFNEAS